jgi:hypothetical protein
MRAGLISGFVVLGIGGRIAMRALAYLTPESPRATLYGTLGILLAGAAWGAVTAPGLLLLERVWAAGDRLLSVAFGLGVFLLATSLFVPLSGFDGRIVAPQSFIVASVVVFPALFLAHGVIVVRLRARWSASRHP